MIANYLKNVVLRKDVLDNLSMLLIGGATIALESEKTKDDFVDWALRIVYDENIKDGILDNMIYKPIKEFFTFG